MVDLLDIIDLKIALTGSAVLRSMIPLVPLPRMVRWIATKEEHAQKIMTTTVPLAIELLRAHKQTQTHTHTHKRSG